MARNLKRGKTGTDVAQLQSMLNRHLSPRPLLDVDGDFGEKTDRAVRAFQRREGLAVDGVAGTNTWEALRRCSSNAGDPASSAKAGEMAAALAVAGLAGPAGAAVAAAGMAAAAGAALRDGNGAGTEGNLAAGQTSAVAELATQIALTQTHVREEPEGSNRGTDVDKYARAAGEEPPILWCMAFVYWAFGEASAQLGVTHPMITVRDGYKDYVTGVYAWAESNAKTVDDPIRGDIFCVRGGSNGRTHRHTGIVTQVNGGTIGTIEGNTNNDGSSNGIGVFARTRSASRLDFIRLP